MHFTHQHKTFVDKRPIALPNTLILFDLSDSSKFKNKNTSEFIMCSPAITVYRNITTTYTQLIYAYFLNIIISSAAVHTIDIRIH